MGKISIRGILATCLMLGLISLLAGCSKKKDETAAPASAPAQSSAPAQPTAEPPPPAPPPSSPAASPAQPAAIPSAVPSGSAQPAVATIASAEGEMPGVTVGIQELKRSSTAMTLKMVYINRTPKNVDMVWLAGTRDLSGVHLLDMAGKKKYFTVSDSEGHCVCSEVSSIEPQGQLPVWAKFPPVPADVQKITVQVPHFPPLEDVPISQ